MFIFVTFSDVDECYTKTHNCQNISGCSNLIGGYFCICHPDYDGEFCEITK